MTTTLTPNTQRIAALANVQLIQLQASLLQFRAALSNANPNHNNGSGSGSGSGATPLEVLAMLSAGAAAANGSASTENRYRSAGSEASKIQGCARNARSSRDVGASHNGKKNISSSSLRSPSSSPRGIIGGGSDFHERNSSTNDNAYGAQPSSSSSPNSSRRLSPPISHIRNNNGDDNGKRKNRRSPPPYPPTHSHPHSQSRKPSSSSLSSNRNPQSTSGTSSSSGTPTTTTAAAAAAPVLSRKPLAHLLAPLPTSSVLYPSRRNPQPPVSSASTLPPASVSTLMTDARGSQGKQDGTDVCKDGSSNGSVATLCESGGMRQPAFERSSSTMPVDMDIDPVVPATQMGRFVVIDGESA